jgi:hypothetical protein
MPENIPYGSTDWLEIASIDFGWEKHKEKVNF